MPTSVIGWNYAGLTKKQFLTQNFDRFTILLNEIDRDTQRRFGSPVIGLSFFDICAVLNAEAGIDRNGHVKPNTVHSLGEYGLLPLPSNMEFWVPDAPRWDRPMALNDNIFYFFSYCSTIKNKAFKVIESLSLYRALFERSFSFDDKAMQSRLLAGVVHGYFETGTYRSGTVPLQHLLNAYRTRQPLDEMIATTDYSRASESILRNRDANIEQGINWAIEISEER